MCRYKKTFIRYKFDIQDSEEEWSQTKEDPNATFAPKYKFAKKHTVCVYLSGGTLAPVIFLDPCPSSGLLGGALRGRT